MEEGGGMWMTRGSPGRGLWRSGEPGRLGQPGSALTGQAGLSGLVWPARPARPARPATPAPAGPRRACSTDGQERSRHGQDTVKINANLL